MLAQLNDLEEDLKKLGIKLVGLNCQYEDNSKQQDNSL